MVDYSRYAKGEILVYSQRKISNSFAREFLELRGYELSEERYKHGCNVHIVKVPEGKEEEFLKDFDAFPDFFEGASLRAKRDEFRWENLEEGKTLLDKLYDSVGFVKGVSSEEYNQELEKIREYLEKIKESD